MLSSSSSSLSLSSLWELVPLPHEQLPPPLNDLVAKYLLLQNVESAEWYLLIAIGLLTILAVVQMRAFVRPPPVPLKRLPQRPTVSILFQPDNHNSNESTSCDANVKTSFVNNSEQDFYDEDYEEEDEEDEAEALRLAAATKQKLKKKIKKTKQKPSQHARHRSWASNLPSLLSKRLHSPGKSGGGPSVVRRNLNDDEREEEEDIRSAPASSSFRGRRLDRESSLDGDTDNNFSGYFDYYNQQEEEEEEEDDEDSYGVAGKRGGAEEEDIPGVAETPTTASSATPQSPPKFNFLPDLPDSFAPLLSSSHVEILRQTLTADLIHAVHVQAGVRMSEGRHEIPLDKDSSRPQLLLSVPKGGVRIAAVASVGSDGFSSEQDLNVHQKTCTRSKPMVKNAGVVFDPPLPLSNVAPTLIHFPTLFEDSNLIPTLRRIQIFRFFLDFVVSFSSLIERCLWIVESKCQIHLSKIRIVPLYKGAKSSSTSSSASSPSPLENTNDKDENRKNNNTKSQLQQLQNPEWRLQLSFSGHVLIFGWIPIPFISVTLPSFIIPQPHALLEYLLTNQPLASGRLKRENIAEQRIALALLGTAESWTSSFQLVATPPAVAVNVTLPGGVTVAVELGLGRDPHAGRSSRQQKQEEEQQQNTQQQPGTRQSASSANSMSSWTTKDNAGTETGGAGGGRAPPVAFDANEMIPWKIELSAKGSVSHDKLSFHILKFAAEHEGIEKTASGGVVPVCSKFGTRGSLAIWKYRPEEGSEAANMGGMNSTPLRRRKLPSIGTRKADSFAHLAGDSPSVAAVLLFPEETESSRRSLRFLQYDYAFDVYEHSKIDAVTMTVGATHPMLNGGTMVTTILDSIYAYGSVAARDDAILDPEERKRKRNILRHLPATDLTLGVSQIYIPPESYSYSDDGQTLFVPDASGGRMMIRLLGGIDSPEEASHGSNVIPEDLVYDGIKVVADFDVPSLVVRSEAKVKEFPELDIFEGVKLRSHLSGVVSGRVQAHLRPEKVTSPIVSTGRNVFNPLEAYEIDFSNSSLVVKIKECTSSLGHRRVIFPAESTVAIKVIESIVDLTFEGKTQCELSWDFQGLSPILQVTQLGQSPEEATLEDKQQISLVIAPLRQGRLSLNVSSVGGINITKAATSREGQEGLYDWKFFNALVSPDQDSVKRILDVLHDKRTMEKLLQVVQLVNKDLHKILRYVLRQVWKAKEIFDKEGISDPKHVIPMYNMSRLLSLFMTGESDEVDRVLPIVDRVVQGDGLDIVALKELLRDHLDNYDDWAPEIDRGVRWLAVAVGPMSGCQPFVEENVPPLPQLPQYKSLLRDIPSALHLYDTLSDKRQLPLDPSFSNLVSRVAPYLTFKQVEFFLETRGPSDWQPTDLMRIRYVYTIKRKVLEIAESYGGLSFLPQSFLVSVFLGEATRTSLRASSEKTRKVKRSMSFSSRSTDKNARRISSKISRLRRRRGANMETRLQQVAETSALHEELNEGGLISTERVAYLREFNPALNPDSPQNMILEMGTKPEVTAEKYELGDSLLGPQDVAILLQAGLTSAMKSSTVVQLNQRMLLDLIRSQPRSFAVAVLAEMGSPSGQGSPRGLTSVLMSLLELDQGSFKKNHQIDMNELLESWLPGLKVPRREDYLAGGRWARQSYYEALYAVANSILEDAESYNALKLHLQRCRTSCETDPTPEPREEPIDDVGMEITETMSVDSGVTSKLQQAVSLARDAIVKADLAGKQAMELLFRDGKSAEGSNECQKAIRLYNDAFKACAKVLSFDKHSFHAPWFKDFYRRNYDALMIKSMHDNVVDDIDKVRYWLSRLLLGAKKTKDDRSRSLQEHVMSSCAVKDLAEFLVPDQLNNQLFMSVRRDVEYSDDVFLDSENFDSQILIDAILDSIIYEETDRERLRRDPLVRLLIPNAPGHYNFTIVTAMGVVTEGKQGVELVDALNRLEKQRGVKTIRSDTATARSLEYNAGKIEEAIEAAVRLGRPYGYIGYSQGCANAFMTETILLSGTPNQQRKLASGTSSLVCRMLLFSAANGSFHGPAMEKKVQRLIVLCEEFFKYQQGYVSRALSSAVLETLNNILDSPHFHKLMGGVMSFLPDGCRAFWREAQMLGHVPTCALRGVLEEHTTPECLEMLSRLLAKQSGSALHDSQVHVFDAVGHPVYHHNRNGRILKDCFVGDGAIQRTHHWSPLSDEVEIMRTPKDVEMASFDCAKDRHVFPWVDVNVRFGFIKYDTSSSSSSSENGNAVAVSQDETTTTAKPIKNEFHPSKLLVEAAASAPVSKASD